MYVCRILTAWATPSDWRWLIWLWSRWAKISGERISTPSCMTIGGSVSSDDGGGVLMCGGMGWTEMTSGCDDGIVAAIALGDSTPCEAGDAAGTGGGVGAGGGGLGAAATGAAAGGGGRGVGRSCAADAAGPPGIIFL